MNELRRKLGEVLTGNVLFLGVGNTDRGDDGAGPLLVRRIKDTVNARCVDGGVSPENYLEKIAAGRPDTVVIVDAVDFGGTPGETRVIAPEVLGSGGISTHALSLRMTCEYLLARSPVSIHLLAVQPGTIEGEVLSEPVEQSLGTLEKILLEMLPRNNPSDKTTAGVEHGNGDL